MSVRALDRKLYRDVWHYRGQLAAIVAVVACGIALFVTLRSMNGYLRMSRDRYYTAYHFANIFAPLKRAPNAVVATVGGLPGVRVAEPRIVYDVTLDIPGLAEPAVGRLVSLPVPRAPMLNDLHLLSGQWPLRDRPTEVLASAAFSKANHLGPGDSVGAVINGRWEWLRIVGTAISPEYVYEIGESAIFPDNRRFGVLWMGRGALANAFDLQGAFNDLVLTVRPGAVEGDVITEVDRVLAPYGGVGAYGRKDQLSHQFLDGEIEETQVTSILLPGIFLAVTAFLLHVVLSRLVTLQREQLAVLKAFGYGTLRVGVHYLQLALVPVLLGGVLGTLVGLWFADQLASVYARFFQFPIATFTPDWTVVGTAIAVGGGTGIVGALGAVARSAALPPAEAMRPERPTRFRHGVLEHTAVARVLSSAGRSVIRNTVRRPWKAALSVTALALALAIVVTVGAMFDAIEYMKVLQFHEIMREDVTVTFEAPLPPTAATALGRLPGVLVTEPFRAVPVRFRTRARTYRTVLLGLPSDGQLHRIVDADGRERRPPAAGMLCSAVLANLLRVHAGDTVDVDVLEGDRPHRRVEVVGVSTELLGATAYMSADAVHRLTGGVPVVSGAYLGIDPRDADAVYARLKRMPAVRAVGVRAAMLASFERTIAESFTTSLVVAAVFACVIAFGMVYNGARVALSERGRELASLRVLGFSRREVTAILLGEQALLTVLAIPLGFAIAYGMCWLVAVRFETELYRLPVVVSVRTYLFGCLVIGLAAVASGLAVRGRVARLDLIAVLKTRE